MVARGPISTDFVVVCSVGDSCWGWVPSLLQSTAQSITVKEQPPKSKYMQMNVTFVKCECDSMSRIGEPNLLSPESTNHVWGTSARLLASFKEMAASPFIITPMSF